MAQLPRYQRIGLTARQPRPLDFAAAREQERFGQTISQQLDRMSDFAFRQASEEAQRRGEERVREEGALPTLEAIREKGGTRTISERSAFDAANRIAVVEIETLAKQDMQSLVREADKNNMAASDFQASMSDIQDGYAASLQEIDPIASGVLSARLSDSAATYTGRYSDISFKKAQAAAKERTTQVMEVGSEEIIQLATQPGSTKESLEVAGEKFKADMMELGVKEKNAQKVLDATLKSAIRQNRLYLYDTADGVAQKKALLEEYEKAPLPGYTYEQNRSFNKQLENNLSSQINREQTTAIEKLTAAIDAMSLKGEAPAGFEIDEDYIRDIFSEEQADEYLSSWEQASEDTLNRGALAYMAPERVEEITLELKADRDAAKTPEDIIKTATRYSEWIESVASRGDAINKDAALFVVQNNEFASGLLESITDQISRGNIDGASAEMMKFRDVVENQFDDLSIPTNQRSIMPKAFASQMVDFIQGIDTDVASITFDRIRNNLGDYGPRFIEELRAANLRPEYVEAMYSTNPAIQKELLDISGRDIKDIKVGVEATDVNDTRKAINLLIANYREGFLAGGGAKAEEIFNEQYMVIEKMALTRVKEGFDPATAAESTVRDIVSEFDQVVLSGQGKYVIPSEFDAQSIETNASMLLNEKILGALNIEPLDSQQYPGFVDEAVSLASIASTGMWLNNSRGDGLVLHYTINGTELPVLTKDGVEYEVKFSELPSIVSRLYAELPDGLRDLSEAEGWTEESKKIVAEQTGIGAPLKLKIVEPSEGFAAEGRAFATGAKVTE